MPFDMKMKTDAQRRDAFRRDSDTILNKPRDSSGRHMTRSWQTDAERLDAYRRNIGSEFKIERREATGRQ
jgi:hypothetical protein